MKISDLKEQALTCLSNAFTGKVADPVPPPHVLQAAVQVLLLPVPKD
jgi:hypothetical protein